MVFFADIRAGLHMCEVQLDLKRSAKPVEHLIAKRIGLGLQGGRELVHAVVMNVAELTVPVLASIQLDRPCVEAIADLGALHHVAARRDDELMIRRSLRKKAWQLLGPSFAAPAKAELAPWIIDIEECRSI